MVESSRPIKKKRSTVDNCHNIVQCSTVHYSTVQYIQYSTL